MESHLFPLVPRIVPSVETEFRRIATPIPVPDSIPILEALNKYEPVSMRSQPPIVWDHADGFNVYDKWNNRWIDWSSGVLVTNVGHNHPRVRKAIADQVNRGLVHSFNFPTEVRANLVKELVQVAPDGLDKAFVLTTGSEAIEAAIKFSRTYGQKVSGSPEKIGIVSFANAFHGRTLGAQMVGGTPALKDWIINTDDAMVQVPFPDGFREPDVSFDRFLASLEQQGVGPGQIAAVLSESYQGGGADFAPKAYIQALRAWCTENQILLIMDEVQAGFGRTGKFWAFEHYGVQPDLITCGKGASGGLPLSMLLGRSDVLDLHPPGSVTNTHGGNPVSCAGALENLRVVLEEDIVERGRVAGEVLHRELRRVADRFSDVVGALHGVGMVAGLHLVVPGTMEPHRELAFTLCRLCYEKGLLMFAPVGLGGGTIKISPPLITPEAAIIEGVNVLEEAFAEAVS